MAECLVSTTTTSNRFQLQQNDENRKLFLGGLSWETGEQDLFDYFNQYGSVDKVTIKKDHTTGRSRGFGFVTFINDDTVDLVLKTGPHIIKNRTVEPKRPKGKTGFKKIFVGGIDGDLTNDEIKSHFEQFGTIENIERPFDRQKQKSREFCFIIFESPESAESAISLPKQIIGGKECDIKLANPHRNNNNNNNNNMHFNHHQNGMMGSGGFMNRGGSMGMGMGGHRGGNQSNSSFLKNRNQNVNSSNWRSPQDHHQNGNFRHQQHHHQDDHYSDSNPGTGTTTGSGFMTNLDPFKSAAAYNSNFLPFWN